MQRLRDIIALAMTLIAPAALNGKTSIGLLQSIAKEGFQNVEDPAVTLYKCILTLKRRTGPDVREEGNREWRRIRDGIFCLFAEGGTSR